MNSNFIKGAIGTVGMALTEVVQTTPALQPEEITTVGNIIIQIVIAIVTVFGIFKKKKS